ncbi:MAG: hypothetical protein ABEI27_02970 [Halobellus sp.]
MPADSFRTKRGTAQFISDAVRFEESFVGYLRGLYRDYWRSDSWSQRVVFVGYVFGLFYGVGWFATTVASGDFGIVAIVVGVVLFLWLVNLLRGFRSPDRIPLVDIESVTAVPGAKGVTRPRLVVAYIDDGSVRKRRVNLPSLYTEQGDAVYECAIEAFEERGIEVARRSG